MAAAVDTESLLALIATLKDAVIKIEAEKAVLEDKVIEVEAENAVLEDKVAGLEDKVIEVEAEKGILENRAAFRDCVLSTKSFCDILELIVACQFPDVPKDVLDEYLSQQDAKQHQPRICL